MRTLDSLPTSTVYRLSSGIFSKDSAYSDDTTKYTASVVAMQRRLHATDCILAVCGMGQDSAKALIIASNFEAGSLRDERIQILSYDRTTGLPIPQAHSFPPHRSAH